MTRGVLPTAAPAARKDGGRPRPQEVKAPNPRPLEQSRSSPRRGPCLLGRLDVQSSGARASDEDHPSREGGLPNEKAGGRNVPEQRQEALADRGPASSHGALRCGDARPSGLAFPSLRAGSPASSLHLACLWVKTSQGTVRAAWRLLSSSSAADRWCPLRPSWACLCLDLLSLLSQRSDPFCR